LFGWLLCLNELLCTAGLLMAASGSFFVTLHQRWWKDAWHIHREVSTSPSLD
jgi:hypothetical protein